VHSQRVIAVVFDVTIQDGDVPNLILLFLGTIDIRIVRLILQDTQVEISEAEVIPILHMENHVVLERHLKGKILYFNFDLY
jgi:hypothetical protein